MSTSTPPGRSTGRARPATDEDPSASERELSQEGRDRPADRRPRPGASRPRVALRDRRAGRAGDEEPLELPRALGEALGRLRQILFAPETPAQRVARQRWLALGALVGGLLAIVIAIATASTGGSSHARPALPPVRSTTPARRPLRRAGAVIRARVAAQLPAPVQDPAVAALPALVRAPRGPTGATGPGAGPSRPPAPSSAPAPPGAPRPRPQPRAGRRTPSTGVAVLGGLSTADSSVSDAYLLGAGRTVLLRSHLLLPAPVHDAAAATLGSSAYLFGGGQLEQGSTSILRVAPSGSIRAVGRLPQPAADVGAAALNGVVYVVGGYTGTRALDTIVAWQPGQPARVVAHLPAPLRYPAVVAAGGQIIIAGGTTPTAAATPDVLSFNPASGMIRPLGRLARPVTHAAAGVLGTTVYLLGGRGSGSTSQHRLVVAIDPRTGRSTNAGLLPHPVSDAGAVSLPDRILLFGGRDTTGMVRADIISVQRR